MVTFSNFPKKSKSFMMLLIFSGCKCKQWSHNIFLIKWLLNPSVHRAKGDRLVRASVLPVCDNAVVVIPFHNTFVVSRKCLTFANKWDPDQARHFVGPYLDPNYLTLWRYAVFGYFEKANFWRKKLFTSKPVTPKCVLWQTVKPQMKCRY